MNRLLILAVIILGVPLNLFSDQPAITSFGNGEIVWSNDTATGYCTVEWAPAVTGSWTRSWQGLYDIPSVIGETRRSVPMFYRVSWSTSNSVPVVRPPEVSGFSATAGNGSVGLSWSNPSDTNFSGVRIVRNSVWYPSDELDGTTVYNGSGNSVLDSGLDNGYWCYYKAFTFNPAGIYSTGSAASALPADTTPPSNVQGFAAVAGDHQVFLNWRNPVSGDFFGVKIVRNVGSPPSSPASGTLVYSGLATNTTDTGLVNGTYYYYKAYSFDASLNYSAGVLALAQPLNLLPPDNVSGLTVQPGDQQVSLRWVNPVGNDFLGVRIQRKVNSAPLNSSDGSTVYQGASQTFTNVSLTNGTPYYYGLFSYDEVPNYSSGVVTSSVASDTTAPGNVSNLTFTVMPGHIALSWAYPPDSDLAGILVQRHTARYPTGTVDGVTVYNGLGTNTLDDPLADGVTTNFYRVFAYDEVPNYSSGATGVLVRPRPVIGFVAQSGDERAILSWTNPVTGNFAGVRIQRAVGSVPSNATDGITVYEGAGVSFTNVGLVNMTQYYYTAFAFDAVPNFALGVVTSTVPRDVIAPDPITAFLATAVPGSISLGWSNPTNADLTGIRIQRKTTGYPSNTTDGVTVFDGMGTSTTDSPLPNGVMTNYYRAFAYDEVTNYTASASASFALLPNVTSLWVSTVTGGICVNWSGLPSTAAGTRVQRKNNGYPASSSDGVTVFDGTGTNAVDSPLSDGVTTNYYRVFAYDAVPNYATGTNILFAPLPNVTGFSASPLNGAVVLRWTNPVTAAFAGVRIQQSTNASPANPSDGITVYQGTSNIFTNSPLTNTVRYYYGAYTFDATPNYSSGAFANAVPADTNAPGNITNLVASSSNGIVSLTWVNPPDSDLTGIRIQRKFSSAPTNFNDGVTVFDGLDTTFTDTGLINGTNYCYRVFAHDIVPNYASGASVTTMPLRILFTETFENAGGWTDHTNLLWTQSASSGVWVVTTDYNSGFYAMTNVAYAHSGQRWLRGGGTGFMSIMEIPISDNPVEVRMWARTPGFSTSGSISLQYYDGFAWYSAGNQITVTGDQYTSVVFKPLLGGHSAQRLKFYTYDALYIDDVEIRVAP